jgi:hypothetical protein
MARGRLRFRQTDVVRALKAVRSVGQPMAVEIAPDGTIRLIPAEQPPQSTGAAKGGPVAPREGIAL